ncbi:MAG: S8 family serine peptidase [Caldilineaceae bacterium]
MSRMMSLLAVLLVIVFTNLPGPALAAQENGAPSSKIAPQVQQLLQTTNAADMVTVIVTLKEKENLSDVNEKLRGKRLQTVIRRLQKRAARTQKNLRTLLQQRIAQGKVANFKAYWIINGLAVTATADVIQELAARSEVATIIPNTTIQAPAFTATDSTPEANITLVNAPALWDLGWQGQGIVVANMDTGVDLNHPDLTAKWRGGANSWFDPYGENPTTPTDNAGASSGHGTWTMGVMVGGATGGTAIGVAPAAQWIAVKIFNNQGSGTVAGIHAAFQWLLDPDGDPNTADAPNVVNSSWTFQAPGCDLQFAEDLQALRAAGILPIFAAGNGGPYPNTSYSPANNPGAFSVGAINNNNQIYGYSSRGPVTCGGPTTTYPALVAPGVNILSSDLYGLYTYATGTSLAAPHAAGALALLLNAYPDLAVTEQEAALINGAADLGAAGADNTFGHGRLDTLHSYQWLTGNAANQAPVVNAGPDQTITPPDAASLNGTASDDGLPTAVFTTTWSVVSGPAAVTFGDANALNTTASFATDGLYTLRLTADDGELTASDELTVTVNPVPVNQPPVVNAGVDQTVTLPNPAALSGMASDDGLPTVTFTTTWSLVSGPGTVTFGDAHALQTSAAFNVAGSYTLRLTADDGQLSTSDDLLITVNPIPNQAPSVNAGPDTAVTLPDSATLNGTAADDGLPAPANLVTTWSVVSGPGAVTFGDANALNTAASFATDGVYTLRLTANDGELTASDDLVVSVSPQASANERIYLSSSSNGRVGGVAFADEDILAYDPATDSWSLLFDGSDVGLGGVDVDAFAFLSDGSLLLSTDNPVTISGIGTVDDSDILHFIPTALGATTAGSYQLYFRGADVGLTTNGEDIDAIDFAPDGRLLISTLNAVRVPGVSGNDEDILAFAPISLGTPTSGAWSLYFDGSSAELTDTPEEIWGLAVDATGKLYLATRGAFAVTGVSGTGADIFACVPGALGLNSTSCDYSAYWQGAAHGFGAEIIDGLYIGGSLPLFSAASQLRAATVDLEQSIPDNNDDPQNGDKAELGPVEEGDALELNQQLFLPLVVTQ